MTAYNGILKINDKDIWNTWHAVISEKAYASVIQYPPMKAVDSNDWYEYNGIEIAPNSGVLDSRSINLPLWFINDGETSIEDNIDSFMSELSTSAYNKFQFLSLGLTFTLRLVSIGNFENVRGIGKLTFTFADDFPLGSQSSEYSYSLNGDTSKTPHYAYSHHGLSIDETSCTIGGKSLVGYYGIRQLELINSANIPPKVREGLTISTKSMHGKKYDDSVVKYGSKDFTIKMLLAGENLTHLIDNYFALLNDIRSNAVTIAFSYDDVSGQAHSNTISALYKSCGVMNVFTNARKWIEFSVTFTALSYIR